MCLNKRNNSYLTAFEMVHVFQHREFCPYTEYVFHVVKLQIGPLSFISKIYILDLQPVLVRTSLKVRMQISAKFEIRNNQG